MLSKELEEVKEKIEKLAESGNEHAGMLVSILEKSDAQMSRVFLENVAPFITLTDHIAENYDGKGAEFAKEVMRRKNAKN
tara:strand:+ start:296 stop:535 length:240 start_codon:yes stop_codon:yes gene_type:complete